MTTLFDIAQNWLNQDPDAETHAELTALLTAAKNGDEIMAGAGVKAYLLPRKLPTPVLAYAIQYFDTTAGVMVTASHNPPEDNGYKVYLGKANGGGQIVSPADKDIAALIDKVAAGNVKDLPRSQDYVVLDDEVVNAYIEKTASLAKEPKADINYVYTAMHGVGYEVLSKTLTKAGLPQPHIVAEQVWPDGKFPTVNFPNPEEKGALDLAIKVAKEHNAVQGLLFGFEEALGYLVDPDKVRDKDGISAAIVFLDLVRHLKAQGKTLADYANDFTQEFGAYVSGQISIRVSDLSEIGKLMAALRNTPPAEVGGVKVAQFIDHTKTDRQSDILVFVLENGSRLIVRPSGTEPKIKFYLDARGKDPKDADHVLAQFDEGVRQILRQDAYGKQDC